MTVLQKILTFHLAIWTSYIIILMIPTKLFLDLYLAKFLAKFLFQQRHSFRVLQLYFKFVNMISVIFISLRFFYKIILKDICQV